jgi:phospholipid/cholesterol/gamma-HCH transport system permease protein
MVAGWLASAEQDDHLLIEAGGGWTLAELAQLDRARRTVLAGMPAASGRVRISLAALEALDTAGAWLLQQLRRELDGRGWQVELAGASPPHAALLAEIARIEARPPPRLPEVNPFVRLVGHLGKATIDALDEARCLLSFFGQTMLVLGRVLLRPRRLRLTSLTEHLEQTCVNALPIVGLIAFLIGVVLAYQGADQLRRFGAEIFMVNLLAISILREVGVLLTAIIVAGRSGSAFTAQIGTMQVNEEIDALRTLGVDPIEVLVLPRLLALIIALPLLVFFADILGLLGGGVVGVLLLGLSPGQFVQQLSSAIWPSAFWVGMIKAPVFAWIIGLVGCYEGLKVAGSAESVGHQTTRAVVVAIFAVIVLDALFSILFSNLGM